MTPNIPELRAALEAATNEGERLVALLALADSLCYNDPREALVLASQSLELAERLGDEHGIAKGLFLMGEANRTLGNFQQSRDQLERARTLYERLGDRAGVARTTGNLAT